MSKLKEFFSDKGIGFYFTLAIAFLSLVTLVVYAATYIGGQYMSWWAFVFVIVAFVGAVGLGALKQYKWAPVLQAVFIGLATMFFIHAVSFYVSVVLVGIDAYSFNAPFIICAVLFVLTFALSVANIFLKQVKE